MLDGSLSLGHLVAFNVYIGLLIWPLRMLGQIIARRQRAAASAQRVQEVLATEPVIVDRPDAVAAARGTTAARGEVRFEDVAFGYERRPGRARASTTSTWRSPPGESVALVGATGCGKSTVARLLPRFYDVDGGRVLLDGVDVRDLRAASTCAGPSASCSRRPSSSATPSPTTSPSPTSTPTTSRSSGRPAWPAPTSSSSACPTATPPRSASGASRCRAASASASPSPGRSSPTPGC